jgi:hypothetical protein
MVRPLFVKTLSLSNISNLSAQIVNLFLQIALTVVAKDILNQL